jgi:hypothetical protein
MKMKIMFLIGLLALSTSCVHVRDLIGSSTSKSEDKLDKKKIELQLKKDELSKNNEVKLKQIGTLSKGVDHALNTETNKSKPIDVAKELNDRVSSLASNPDIKDVNRIKKVVDDLVSEVEKERKVGEMELTKLDKELQYVQSERDLIKTAYEKKSAEYAAISEKIAEDNDKNEAIVGEMDKWFGLGAVWYGVKKFLISAVWILSIGTIVFLVLRVLSQTNPVAAAVFGLFEMAGSAVLQLVKVAIPNSFSYAKFVDKGTSEKYRGTLDKILDTLQVLKEQNKLAPDDKKIDLEMIFAELDKKLDDAEKRVVTERLQSMNWKI